MKRKSIFLMVVIVISLALIGCGGKDKEPAKTGGSAPVSDTATQVKVELGNSEINLGTGKSGKNMELAAEFPADILPLIDDAQIDHIMKNDANKAININYNTGKSLEEAAAFYKEVMKDGRDTQEISGDDSHLIMGVKGDYVVTISIVDPNGETIVNIDARPQAQ